MSLDDHDDELVSSMDYVRCVVFVVLCIVMISELLIKFFIPLSGSMIRL
jgi:hypothetical protein